MSDNPTREGRSRLFYLERSALLEMLRPIQVDAIGSFSAWLLGSVEMPKDAYVSSVTYDYTRMAFCVQVDSMEFSPVAEGCMIPEIPVKGRIVEGKLTCVEE